MKRSVLSALGLVIMMTSGAQVQVRPLPVSGYEQRIRDFVYQMKVVDTHEHLLNPANFDRSMLDFMLLLRHYSMSDFQSAGMPAQDFDKLLTNSLTPIEKWKALKPYWDLNYNTGYNRGALVAADKLFGVKDINETTVAELSEKIEKAYQTDWYRQVLKQKCNIEYVIHDYPYDDWENRFFGDLKEVRYVRKFDRFIFINTREDVETLSQWKKDGIDSLEDLVTALKTAFDDARQEGIVAVKSILAYSRTLLYENVSKEKAEEVFNKILKSPDRSLEFDEVKPLQDYMMHRVLDLADANDLPVQLHTGLNNGDIEIAKPTLLLNLINEYPDVKFILFHGSYPYGGELSVLAKKFRNVYIDLCWLYIISPSASERNLHEWLETVPAGKIMAFGGDFFYVEDIYSHLLFAREIVANVLIDKVKSGYFSEDEAIRTAQLIFHDNAIRILNLK